MMTNKQSILFSTVMGLAIGSLSLSAQAGTQDILSANNQAGIQLTMQHMDYSETYQGVLLDTENGNVPGIDLSVSVMKDLWLGNDYLQAEYAYSSGKTDYVGSYQGGSYGSLVAKSGAEINDFSIRYGKGYVASQTVMLTPYGEFGYHQWDRNVGDGIPGGYMEHYSHKYLAFGILGQYSPVARLVLTGNVMAGRTLRPAITVDLPAPQGFSAGLGNSAIYKASIAADYAFTKTVHGNAGIDYTTWQYGASAIQPSGYLEPDSKTYITTFKVGVGYAF